MNHNGWIAVLALTTVTLSARAGAQGQVFVYPPEGRSQQQQKMDQFECHQWAVEQTQFDPAQFAAHGVQATTANSPAAAVSQSTAPTAGKSGIASGETSTGRVVVASAAQGAAISAVADGDAAKGAAAGAGVGLLRKRMMERQAAALVGQQQLQEQQRAAQRQAAQASSVQANALAYQTARSTCLRGRGYTIGDTASTLDYHPAGFPARGSGGDDRAGIH